MFIVGLTGGLCTGKSTVLEIFKENGIAVIDADLLAKNVIDPGTEAWEEMKEYFGDEIILPNGHINREAVAELIYNNYDKRKKVHEITHPRIHRIMTKMAFSYFIKGHKYVVMEVPLLFEARPVLASFMHKIITVVCKEDQQINRLCEKAGFTETIAETVVSRQMPLRHKMAYSNFVIDNSGSRENTRQQTEQIIQMLNESKFTWYFRAALLISGLSLVYGAARVVAKKLN